MKKAIRYFAIMILYCIASILITSCGTTKFTVPIKRPAEINLSGFKKIAIGEITGKGSQDLTEELTMALFNSKRFEVLDRQHLNKMLQEHNLNMSGLVNKETAAKLGELIGSSALIFGRLAKYDYDEELTKDDWQDNKGNWHTSYYRNGIAKMDASLQVTDLTTGKIMAIKKLYSEYKDSKSATDAYPDKINSEKLLLKCRDNIVNQFMKVIAPYTENVEVTLLDDDEVPEFKKAIRNIKMGDWLEAQSLYQEAVNKYPTNPKVHYNLGVVYEYNGNFDQAAEQFKKAYSIEENDLFLEELENCKKRKIEQERLKEQVK